MMKPEDKFKKCPKCGAKVEYSFSPSEQEYAGAHIWPAFHSWECSSESCDWDASEDGDSINGQENTRGY